MARASWIDDDEVPQLQEHLSQLEHFTQSMADGVIDDRELAEQEKRLVAAMKAVEGELSDELHGKVTALLAELTAYNVMNVLHELAASRAKKVFA